MKARHIELTEVKFSLVMDGLKFHSSEEFAYNQSKFGLVKNTCYIDKRKEKNNSGNSS